MKKDKESLVFDNAKIDDISVDDIKPLDMSVIAKQIAEAYNEALKNEIEANTVQINNKYAKTNRLIFPGPANGCWDLPPMFCGLRVAFSDLPEKFAFVLTKTPIKTADELKEEVRKETAKDILRMLIGHEMRDNGAHMAWVIVKQDVAFIAEKYGIELFGKTEQVGNSDKLEDKE